MLSHKKNHQKLEQKHNGYPDVKHLLKVRMKNLIHTNANAN